MNASSILQNVTLQQLRYFLAVAESRSYSLGDRVARTQPAVSRGIRQLERILGHALFLPADRTQLTPFGVEMLEAARTVLGSMEALARRASDAGAGDELVGPLIVGTKLALAEAELPAILKRLKKRHPKLEVRVRSKDGAGLLGMLARGDVEVVISHERVRAGNLAFQPLFARRRILIAPRAHPILKAKRLSPAEIARHPIILPERDSRTARAVMDALSAYAPTGKLQVPIQVMSAEARSRYVSEGWGIAIAEEGHEVALPSGLASRPIPESILPARIVGVYTVKDRYLSAAAEAFLGECRARG